MKEHIDAVILKHCEILKTVDTTKSIPLVVKQLDKMVYDMYRELYGLRDIRSDNYYLNSFTADDKKGHCC